MAKVDVDVDYPTIFYGDPGEYARVLNAIHIACVDAGGEVFDAEYSDADLDRFWQTSPHRYFSVRPSGGVQRAVSAMEKAILSSIEKGELKLASVRKNLAGEVSLLNSWVEFGDFEEWCEARGIELGEIWFEFCKDDAEIKEAAVALIDSKRRAYEGFYLFNDIDEIKRKFDDEGADSLIMENAVLRAELRECKSAIDKPQEKPLNKRQEANYLAIIGGLVELLLNHRPGRINATAIINELLENYPEKEGVSKRNLEKVFPLAKRRLESS